MAADGSVNTQIQDRLVSYRLDLLRYEKGVAQRFEKTFADALKDVDAKYRELSERIAKGASTDLRQLNRLFELRGEISDALAQVRKEMTGQLSEALSGVAESEVRAQATIFRNVGINFAQIPDAAVARAVLDPVGGVNWPGDVASDLKSAEERLQGVLARGIARGASMPSVAKNIAEWTGIQETYRNRFVAIARTEIQRVSNTAALAGYLANDDVVGGVQWLATLDSRTCIVCGPLHNQTWKLRELNKIDRIPPVHPRCRCFLAPVTKSWSELGIAPDPRRDGEPGDGPGFEQWLKRQSGTEQLKVFDGSEERLRLWRQGLSMAQFVRDFKPIPLAELRRRAEWYQSGGQFRGANASI